MFRWLLFLCTVPLLVETVVDLGVLGCGEATPPEGCPLEVVHTSVPSGSSGRTLVR